MTTQHNDDPHRLASAAVVVGTDGSEAADLAVRWAAETASQRHRRLRIVYGLDLAAAQAVMGSYNLMVPAVIDAMRDQGAHAVRTARRLAHDIDPGLTVETEVSEESPAALLIRHSKSAYLVAIGAAGEGGTISHLGSTLLAVASHGHGAVVVVRDTGTEQQTRHLGPVVVGVDGSPVSEAAVGAAFAEASDRKTQLVAVHAWSDLHFDRFAGMPNAIPDRDVAAQAEQTLAEQLAGWQEKYPDVKVIRKVYLSGPSHHLLEWSRSAQLLVVGSRGRGGFRGLLLGSTSNGLVQYAHCPVMVVHSH
ncbi:universal stress protein [Nocardia sp. CS682]|uniref:universal stress protein n=1 Tax=Nocardia sp. CS682 TaxID=1047172 RepID=UPI00107518DB|nr:universal stress protein [Nocardia sp. CS682]QBS45337.1 universal stress protein [Nocardia sp. CS682]